MNLDARSLGWLLVWSAAAGLAGGGPAAAQQAAPATAPPSASPAGPSGGAPAGAPAKSTAQIDAGEPRASTSPVPPVGGGTVPPAAAAGDPAAQPASRSGAANRAPRATAQKTPGSVDRLDLTTATVTGDREQPKVMYIVPWKKSDIGDLSGKPMNSLLDEALAPVDRDEFKREVTYYDAIGAGASQNGASKTPVQGEK
jgi:hypothetical protein